MAAAVNPDLPYGLHALMIFLLLGSMQGCSDSIVYFQDCMLFNCRVPCCQRRVRSKTNSSSRDGFSSEIIALKFISPKTLTISQHCKQHGRERGHSHC